MKIKHYELVQIAEEFLKNFNMELTIPIEYNSRLKKVLGRFIYKRQNGENIPEKIEVSIDFMMSHPKEHIIDVFKHELVHYALCYQKLPFNDGDKVFEDKLKELGVNSTYTYPFLGEMHKYICNNCGKEFDRKRKLVKTAYCLCSKGPNLEYKGTFNKKLEDTPYYAATQPHSTND